MRWVKSDDEDFDMEGRAKQSYDGNMTFTLILPNVRKSDRGEFLCVANNNLALAKNHTKPAVLKINCKYYIDK